MTNFERLKELSPEDFVRFIFGNGSTTGTYCCMQQMNKLDNKVVWQKHCLSTMGRDEDACYRCRVQWLKANIGVLEEPYRR